MTGAPLDERSTFRVDPTLTVAVGPDGTPVAVGGSPMRLLRLRPPADAVLAQLRAGATLGEVLESLAPQRRAAASRFVATLVQRGIVHAIPTPNGTRRFDDVTIVVPVRDRAEPLRRLLNALEPARARGAQLIVVDDGSSDASASVASEAGAVVLAHTTSRGPAAARNAGASAAVTAFVAFLDSDVVPIEGWLDLCIAHLDADGAARADLVAPRIVGLADVSPNAGASVVERYEYVRSALDLGPEPALIAPTTRVAYVPAATLVVRAATFASVGGFDEALHVGEDVDLLWRLHSHGAVLRYEPGATVAHDHRATVPTMLRRRYQYGTAAAALDARHRGRVPPAVLSPWSVAVWLPMVLHPLGVAVGGAVAVWTGERLADRLAILRRGDARRLAVRGHLAALEQTADAMARTWFPFAVTAALLTRRRRLTMALAAATMVQGLRDYRRRRPPLDPARFVALRTLDDAAYGCGVVAGSMRHRRLGALMPKLANWPGRTKPDEDAVL